MKISVTIRWIITVLIINVGCDNKQPKQNVDVQVAQWKEELRQLEAAHMDTVTKYGFIKSLPIFWGDEFALINRNGTISVQDSIKAAIARMPENRPAPQSKLFWKPEFIDVAPSGEMGYTYGYYQVIPNDTTQQTEQGSYLTIWKKDENGKWRLVID